MPNKRAKEHISFTNLVTFKQATLPIENEIFQILILNTNTKNTEIRFKKSGRKIHKTKEKQ